MDQSIALDDEQARRFVDALDEPEAFRAEPKRLADRPRVLGADVTERLLARAPTVADAFAEDVARARESSAPPDAKWSP